MAIILDILADWKPLDYNGDGFVTGSDIGQCGFEPGSTQAKLAWEKVFVKAHSASAIKQAKLCGYEDAKGWYNGKPIMADTGGSSPHPDNFEMLKDRLIWYKGISPEAANKIVDKLMQGGLK